jgi:3-oxoacyl-[acyl-carrier protein] reductase
MADFLVNLGANNTARKMVKTLGLPIPLPQKLWRQSGPWEAAPLADRDVVVHADGELTEALAGSIGAAGANPWVLGDLSTFAAHGEAWGRPPKQASDELGPKRAHGLVFDATGISSPDALRALYDFYKPRLRGLGKCGRVVVLGRPAGKIKNVQRSAAQRALLGFVKSLGREVGKTGCTANLIVVHDGAEDRLDSALRFVLGARSAFVTGQQLTVSKTVRAPGEVPTTRPLGGKTALVTGAARGIGKSIARSLAREGAHVIVVDIPSADGPLSKVADEVSGTALLLDVTSADAVSAIHAAAQPHGGLDIAIHNAGVTQDKTLKNMKPELWDMTLGINLAAVANLCEGLELNSGGRIVLLSSIAGIAGNIGQTNYSASKAGVIGLTEALGPKLARRGIAVNAIAPGFIETRLTKAIPAATREVARRLNSLSQGGLPEDIAEVATYLSSPGAAAHCGMVVRVCGGNLVGA